MRAALRLAVAGALALGVVAGPIPAASASSAGDDIVGGCSFDSALTVNSDQVQGVISDTSFTAGPTGLPTGATVECWILVNGVKVDSTDLVASGFGAQANAKPVSFTLGPFDIYDVCRSVVYADGSTDPCDLCTLCFFFPPRDVTALLDILDHLEAHYVDPNICPKLVKVAGTYGPVTIAPDGDVTVTDPLGFVGLVWDCPPYGSP